jgi:polygalacturonase
MMKRLLLAIIVLAFACQICYGVTPPFRFNVQDFGAVGDGTTEASGNIQACADAAYNAGGGSVFFPKGTYQIKLSSVAIPNKVTSVFQQGATIYFDQGLGSFFDIYGKIDAGLFQIFSGAYPTLYWGVSSWLYPQWWGVVGDGVTDDTAAFFSCIGASVGVTILIPPGNYAITDDITFIAASKVRLISPVTFTVSAGKTVTFSGRMLGDIPTLAGAGSLSYVNSKTMFRAVKALTFANPLAVNMNDGNVFTVTATGNSTFNASNGIAGMEATFIIANDGVARTITFGANFKPVSTLVGIINKTSTIKFSYDGANWWEVSRVVGTL